MSDFEPFELHEPDGKDGTWSLWLSFADNDLDDEESAAVFAQAQRNAGGYGWEGVALYLLEEELPHVADDIELDCEDDTFCAYSSNPEALRQLAEQLSTLFHDPVSLTDVLAQAPQDLLSIMAVDD